MIEKEIAELYVSIDKTKAEVAEKPSKKGNKALEDLQTKLEALYKEYESLSQ
jgi:hypothetical protein